MNETISCPSCHAELMLPAHSTGQTVQCARCQNVFEPALRRALASTPYVARPMARDDAGDEPIDGSPNVLRYQPLTGLWKANVAIVLLAFSSLACVLHVYVRFERIQVTQLEAAVFRQPQNRIRPVRPVLRPHHDRRVEEVMRRQEQLHSLTETAGFLHLVTFWPAALFVLIWTNHGANKLRILQCGGLKFSPPLATFCYFIPMANLFLPCMAVQEIWRASEPNATTDPQAWRTGPRSRLVVGWWLTLLASLGLSFIAMTFGDDPLGFDERNLQAKVAIASDVCMVAAGAMLIAVIRSVSNRQRVRHAKIYDDAGD